MQPPLENFDLRVDSRALYRVGGLDSSPETPELAVSCLSLLDVANVPHWESSLHDRIAADGLVIGPTCRDEEGRVGVMCWSRLASGTSKEHPSLVSMTVVPVHKAHKIKPREWRRRMIAEAHKIVPVSERRTKRIGPVHFVEVKDIADLEAIPITLLEVFGKDGEPWAELCDNWIDYVDVVGVGV